MGYIGDMMKNKKHKQQLKYLAQVRGKEREEHFANGGTIHDWRGGLHTITKNKKKEASRKACRKNWRS